MKIVHVLFPIADNGVSGVHLHVELDEELPATTKLWSVLWLTDTRSSAMPGPYYVTGLRSPASKFVTIQMPEETSRAERERRLR